MSVLYRCRDLTQRYGGRTVLRLPELSVARGEVLALTGPNGAGKSTLLRLLAFLESPASGELCFHGTPGRPPRQDVTLLLQEPYLFKASVFENVVYGLRVRGRRHDLRQAAEGAMLAVGFTPEQDMLRRSWKALSGGEKQRVALAGTTVVAASHDMVWLSSLDARRLDLGRPA